MYASQGGHVETVLEMIPYAKTGDLEQALCRAASGGHLQLMTALLENSNVSPDATSHIKHAPMSGHTTGGESALMLAVASLEPECVRVLLEKGASVRKESPREVNGPRLASRRRHSKPGERSPLHSLAQRRMSATEEVAARKILDMLLSAGADLKAADSQGNTPLLVTIGTEYEAPKSLDLFLSAGADPCDMDSNGETLLHRACRAMSNTKVASQLLSYKAIPGQARSSDGVTPLHW